MIKISEVTAKALKKGIYRKNLVIDVFSNQYGMTDQIIFTLNNENIREDSLKYNERLYSGEQFHYGKCEGSLIEFEYVGETSILNHDIYVSLECWNEQNEKEDVPLGRFTVQKCVKDIDNEMFKVKAYNRLAAPMLDQDAKNAIQTKFFGSTWVYLSDIINALFEENSYSKDGFGYIYHTSREAALYVRCGGRYNLQDNNFTPFNHQNMDVMTNLYPYIHQIMFFTDLFPTSHYKFKFYDSSMEWLYYDWFENVIGTVVGSSNSQAFINGLFKTYNKGLLTEYDGWRSMFCVKIRFEDGHEEYYSTVGKTYYPDQFDGTLYAMENQSFYKAVRVECVIPYALFFSNSSDYPKYGYDVGYKFEDGFSYVAADGETQKIEWTFPNDEKPITYRKPYEEEIFYLKQYFTDEQTDIDNLQIDVTNLPDVTFRQLLESVLEIKCKFGRVNRTTNDIEQIVPSVSSTVPLDDLYPSDKLYPGGSNLTINKPLYSSVYLGTRFDIRQLTVSYKTVDESGKEVNAVITRNINPDGTDDYEIKGNWLLDNYVWTTEKINEIVDYVEDKLWNMDKQVSFDLKCIGLPYIECGDGIEIHTGTNVISSFILEREMHGIMRIEDNFYNGSIDKY